MTAAFLKNILLSIVKYMVIKKLLILYTVSSNF
jgi:hypothetical protein